MRSARGATGRLLVGYQVAADLVDWAYGFDEAIIGATSWTVSARIARADPFWLEHEGAMVLELDFGDKRLVWPAVRADVSDTAVAVTGTGAPEVR